MNAFFLDDRFLEGELPVVAAVLQRLLVEAAERGLEPNLAKCTLVLPADAAQQDLSALFPADLLCDPTFGESRVSTEGNFDILKAAIGGQAHCEAFAEDRVTAAGELMRLLPGIGNPQVALRLLKHCSSYCKVVHNMRATPPDHQLDVLKRFDTEVRETFGLMTGLALTDSEWDQAARGMAHAGLALRMADGVARPSGLHGIAGGVIGPRAGSRRRVLHRHAAYGAGVDGPQQPRAGMYHNGSRRKPPWRRNSVTYPPPWTTRATRRGCRQRAWRTKPRCVPNASLERGRCGKQCRTEPSASPWNRRNLWLRASSGCACRRAQMTVGARSAMPSWTGKYDTRGCAQLEATERCVITACGTLSTAAPWLRGSTPSWKSRDCSSRSPRARIREHRIGGGQQTCICPPELEDLLRHLTSRSPLCSGMGPWPERQRRRWWQPRTTPTGSASTRALKTCAARLGSPSCRWWPKPLARGRERLWQSSATSRRLPPLRPVATHETSRRRSSKEPRCAPGGRTPARNCTGPATKWGTTVGPCMRPGL